MANHYICTDVYTVRAGDTLYSIAQRYQVEVDLLMRANRVRNPYNLRIGTKLCIPGPVENTPVPQPLPEVEPEESEEPPGRCARRLQNSPYGKNGRYPLYDRENAPHQPGCSDAGKPDIDPYNLRIGTNLCIPE